MNLTLFLKFAHIWVDFVDDTCLRDRTTGLIKDASLDSIDDWALLVLLRSMTTNRTSPSHFGFVLIALICETV